jgi:RHS repeat-associated protein
MAVISSKAAGKLENKKKFNSGSELQSGKFSDGTGLEWYDVQARFYDPQIGRFIHVDPKASELPQWSPYVAFADNPIYYVDPDGQKFINFDADGNYTGTTKDNWFHNLFVGNKGRILNAEGDVTRSFRFADPKSDVADIQSGVITKLVVVKEQQIQTMMARAGVFDAENKTANKPLSERYDYIKAEGIGGGKLDFSYTQIPDMYPGASDNPLGKPSSMIFLTGKYAHNQMNFGNFLFGAAGYGLGYSKPELLLGAHWNSLFNSETNGYPSQFDSSDDQFSIQLGVGHSYKQGYRSKQFSIEVGPLSSGTVVPDEN